LDDVAHVALRALQADAALVVIDGGANRWIARKTGAAVATACTAAGDERSEDLAALVNPIEANDRGFAFYAATPLRDSSGVRMGTLAILGEKARTVSEDDLATLRRLAEIIEIVA
jgi:GAF domain-containing protein